MPPEIPREAGVDVCKTNANKCKIIPFIRFQAVSNECSKQTIIVAVATRFTNPIMG